ncbi:CAP domain-containing protein [Neogemmobacter tilapiae]|uniref:SCP domain-containing protein n=1 Tax=Neogemmobacter tilapiae TaxID=875041 RepID=A0A918TDU2_9RHOB|nr:CAP domain-containing protein [Gemmobacter tilapiae]GHC44900.1 hypothetical protein GCM10007315_02720 [Gemmobacter tilapiae]
MGLSAAEQYGIELLNRARMDPSKEAALQKIGLNQGNLPGPISTAPKQVLAPSTQLQVAAEKHSNHMLRVDKFAHDGIGDGTPSTRFRQAGFDWTANAENINYASVGFANSLERLTAAQHGMLFDSAGHRYNLLSGWLNEVGYGLAQGNFGGHKVSMLTQGFGSRGYTYVTGVVFNDKNGNNFYNIGEGRQGLAFSMDGGRLVKAAAAGGYALRVTPSDNTRVSIDGGRKAVVEIDTLNGRSGFNAKLDVVSNNLLLVSTSTYLVSGSIKDMKALGISAVTLTGSESNNRLWGNIANNTLNGQGGNDTLFGGSGQDKLYGGDGNDSLLGQDGDDTLWGDAGDDTLDGGNGTSTLNGGDGDDRLLGQKGHDRLNGEAGHDYLSGSLGNDTMSGGEGNDMLIGGDGNDDLSGGVGDDELFGGNGDDSISGGDGIDQLFGGAGHDSLRGNGGDDELSGEAGNDSLLGEAGNDLILGGDGNDTALGGEGNDTLNGENGDDLLYGDAGNDRVDGDAGNDTLYGGSGDDTLQAGDGNNLLSGDDGNDLLNGDAGSDTLIGGAGDDTLTGGEGADVFVFSNSDDSADDVDVINDFNILQDVLRISSANLNDAQDFVDWASEQGNVEVDGTDVVLHFEFGDTLRLKHTTLEQLMTAQVEII